MIRSTLADLFTAAGLAAADAARLVALWQRIDPAATLRALPA